MTIKTLIAGSATAALLFAQTAVAGSLAPVVDCNVTPDAPECAVVTLAPAAGSSASLGGLGTAAAVGGGLLALGAIAALANDDDDDDDTTAVTTQ